MGDAVTLDGKPPWLEPTRKKPEPLPLTDDRMWTPDDVVRFLGVSKSMVYKLDQTGQLPSIRIGACVRFDPRVVRAFARGEGVSKPAAK